MQLKKIKTSLLMLSSALFIAGYSAPVFAIDLPPQNYIDTLRQTDFYSNRTKDTFTNTLANEYKSYALYKAQYTNDFDNANRFAMKALTSYHGERVRPENVYQKRLPSTSIINISNYYDDLLYLLDTDLINKYPQLMAEAQAKFDCWIDSEANGASMKQSATCFNRFKKARDYLYAKLEEGCNTKCKVKKQEEKRTIKKYDGKILPIPKWPNLPTIANNPPIPVIRETVVRENNTQTIKTNDTARVDNTEIQKSLATITGMIGDINKRIARLKPAGRENGTNNIIVANDDSATTDDINALKSEIAKLEQKLHSIENNGNENFNELKNQLSSLEDAVSNIDCCSVDEVEDDEEEIEEEPIFKKVDEDEVVEIEITDKPSDLLPFELFFDWNKADVDYKFIPQIKDIAEKALKSKEIIVIQGHTDTSGTPEYNKVLSQKRAENVGKIVMNYGIPREKIVLQGVGATDPKIPTKDGVKKPENRRVVIK